MSGDEGRELAIKADHGVQVRLLDLQGVDTTLAQLAHRRKTLPEHAELSRLYEEHGALVSAGIAADTAVSDLEVEQNRAESDLEPVRERLTRNENRIADGSVSDPKALGALIEEVEHLGRRISDLEDAELEIMQQLENAHAERERLRSQRSELGERIAAVESSRDRQLAELDADTAARTAERAEIAPLIPADLNALYDKVGARHGGVGAAELRQGGCSGCQLEINAADLRVFAAAPDDEVLRCEECSRILVRTAQSGL